MECTTPGNINIKIIRYVGRTNKRKNKKKIDDACVEYAIIYMENKIHELERAERLLRGRHPIILIHPTNE